MRGVGASRLYTRSTPESDSEVAESERHSSSDKNLKDRGRERFTEGLRDAREDDLQFYSNVQSCRACHVWEGAVKRRLRHSLLDFHPPIQRPPKQQNSGVSIPISN
jgi:hypothetical protein